MNTRLQVEHPVTECVTGLDLVEQMIRVAAGEKLGFAQQDVRLDGWAVETRVYAEDPYRNFLPSTGRLSRYRPPAEIAGVRVDTGVVEGSEISMFYDPMVAKLVTSGATREEAIDRQIMALDRYEIDGVGHNIDFLSSVMQHPRFRSGEITTGFIAEEYAEGFTGAAEDEARTRDLAAVAALVASARAERAGEIDGQLNGRPPISRDWVVRIDGVEHQATVENGVVIVDGVGLAADAPFIPGQRLVEAVVDGRPLSIRIALRGARMWLTSRGRRREVIVLRPAVAALAHHMIEQAPADLSRYLVAPMPGLLTRLDVAVGDTVEAGQALGAVEAMKMENILRATKAAKVKAVGATVGSSLAIDQIILEFE